MRIQISFFWVWVWVLYYNRRSVGQSVLKQSTHLGLTTRFLLLSDSCGFVDVGRSLWQEDGSVVYNCSWPSPAQSFSGLSPVRLVTIFYCIRIETSLFIISYDLQGTVEVFDLHLILLANCSPFLTSKEPNRLTSRICGKRALKSRCHEYAFATVRTTPRVLLSEAPSNNGLFQLLGSVYLAVA
jgi:hypothetical protein